MNFMKKNIDKILFIFSVVASMLLIPALLDLIYYSEAIEDEFPTVIKGILIFVVGILIASSIYRKNMNQGILTIAIIILFIALMTDYAQTIIKNEASLSTIAYLALNIGVIITYCLSVNNKSTKTPVITLLVASLLLSFRGIFGLGFQQSVFILEAIVLYFIVKYDNESKIVIEEGKENVNEKN